MKGARRIHGIISSRSEQLPLWGFLQLRNLLQNLGPDPAWGGRRRLETDEQGQQPWTGSHRPKGIYT